MSAFASVTLQNNAAANVVFTPSSIDSNGVAQWFAPGAVLDARPRLTLKVSNPKAGSNVARVSGKVVVPIMDTVDTTVKVAESIGSFEFVFPKQTSSTLRLDIRKHLDTLLTNAIITAAATDLEAIY